MSAFPGSSLPAKGETNLPETASSGAKKGFVPRAPEASSAGTALTMPPPLPLPKPQEQMDVFVTLACHPGYFVLQPWQEMHNLEVLMEEMLLYYGKADEGTTAVEKNKLYAAKVKNM